MSSNTPAYGTPNYEMLKGWLTRAPEDDGPFWALNLMKYRAVADYGDGSTNVSGREADDAYAPLDTLAAIGAEVALFGNVVAQPVGTPGWDRVGIVRYPTRRSFLEMQQRADFQKQHVHKEAGMEFTIVMATLPEAVGAPGEGRLVLTVARGGKPRPASLADFSVEGVIVGDERTFDTARFDVVTDDAALASIVDAAKTGDDAYVVVVQPSIDHLLASIEGAHR
jgi:hypothetical protein